jgi:hypothetical protein
MSRGWESKDVESQQEEAAARRSPPRQPGLTPEQIRIATERDSLELHRKRVIKDLDATMNPRRQAQLRAALAHLNEKLAAFK